MMEFSFKFEKLIKYDNKEIEVPFSPSKIFDRREINARTKGLNIIKDATTGASDNAFFLSCMDNCSED